MHYDVITVGSATIDVFAHTDPTQAEELNLHNAKEIAYPLGAKILIKELNFFTGGGGTNTAVSFSRLGLKTAYFGRLGADTNGDIILKNLQDEHADYLGIRKGISGYSVILDSVHDDRTIFTFKGCNDELNVTAADYLKLDCSWFYFSSMMGKSHDTLERLASYAQKKGIKTAYNPSLYIARKGASYSKKILASAEVLVLNKEEAQALMKSQSDNIYELLDKCSAYGPKIVVITDGKNGCNCYNAREQMYYSLRPQPVKIVETTGAGDAFASGFVAGLIKGSNTETALKIGMLNAESLISGLGAKTKLMDARIFAHAGNDKRIVVKRPRQI